MQAMKTFELKELITNIQGVHDSSNLLETLMDFERVLDDLDCYAFPNWGKGELVEGPITSRHWVSATFMWPEKLPPDPKMLERLENNSIKTKITKGVFKHPIEVESENDFRSGTKYPKLVEDNVWLIELTVPKQMIKDIEEGYANIAGEMIDMEDIDSAYERDFDNEGLTDSTAEDFTE